MPVVNLFFKIFSHHLSEVSTPVALLLVFPLSIILRGGGLPVEVKPPVLGAVPALFSVRPLGAGGDGGGGVRIDGLRLEQLKGVVSWRFRSARKLHAARVGQRERITALQAGQVVTAVIICNTDTKARFSLRVSLISSFLSKKMCNR